LNHKEIVIRHIVIHLFAGILVGAGHLYAAIFQFKSFAVLGDSELSFIGYRDVAQIFFGFLTISDVSRIPSSSVSAYLSKSIVPLNSTIFRFCGSSKDF